MIHFDRQIVVGVALDLSIQHHTDGGRYIDIVKTNLIDFATKLGLNCGIYVAHPNNHTMPRQQGESVAAIASFADTLGYKASEAFAQAAAMISAQEGDEKYVILVTDRYRDNLSQLEKTLNTYERSGCRFMLIGIGDRYNKEGLKELSTHKGCQVFHFADPHKAGQKFNEAIIIGV